MGDAAVPGNRWLPLAAALALPALVIGVLLYPDNVTQSMPTLLAGAVLLGTAMLFLALDRPRLMLLLPVVASFLPSATAGFLGYMLALIYFAAECGGRRLVRPLDSVDWALTAVLVWVVASWIVNMGIETDPWSLPLFTLTFLSPWLLLVLARAAPWTQRDLEDLPATFLALATAQLAPLLCKPLLLGTPGSYVVPLRSFSPVARGTFDRLAGPASGDFAFGTTASAHYLGIILLLAIVLLVARSVARHRLESRWIALALGFGFLMTDAKHVVLAAIPAGCAFYWIAIRPAIAPFMRQLATLALLLALLAGGRWAKTQVRTLVDRGLWKPLVALTTLNPKVQLVLRTADRMERNDVSTWMGLGPGSYASRAATIRATDVLFKDADHLPAAVPPHTGESYRAAAYDLYTSEIALTIQYRSAVLTSPFSSVIGVIAEFGVLGALLVGWLFLTLAVRGWRLWRCPRVSPTLRAAGAAFGFAIPLLAALGLFDSYFEQPGVTATVILLGVVTLGALDRAATGSRSAAAS